MYIITMLLLISILVLVHELGHFGVARMIGVKPEKFGFGLPFGPTLYETKWGDTTICIHALLLGGYVAFADDDPDSEVPKDDPSRLSNRKVWERFLIVSAGVTANAVLAFFIVLFVAAFSHNLPSGQYKIFVDQLQPGKTLAANSIGIQKNDEIISANGVKIDSPIKFIEIAQKSKKYDNYVSYARIGEQKTEILKLNPELKTKLDSGQLIPAGMKIVLPDFSPESPLSISNNDLSAATKYTPEGEKLNSEQQSLRNKIADKKDFISDGKVTIDDLAYATGDTVHPIYIMVNRNGNKVELPAAYPNKQGLIGLKLRSKEIDYPVTGFVSAVKASTLYLHRNVNYMVSGLGQIVTGQIPLDNLHGIVAVTKVGGDIIEKRGMWDGLLLTALISIDLAIVNLLPIPALDGGHLLFLLIEKLRGRPVDEKMQEAFARYGFMFLIGLMILIVFNDVWALVTDKL